MRATDAGRESSGSGCTLLTNHSHVLICIAEDTSVRSRDELLDTLRHQPVAAADE